MESTETEQPKITGIAEGPQQDAAARSALYRELAAALRFPWQDFHRDALSGKVQGVISELIEALPYRLQGAQELCSGLARVKTDYDLFQSDYVGLFDVGTGGPPCPLYGGAWGGDRQKVMEEALRFYRYFGLTLSTKERDLPDHGSTELEFCHFLTFREAEAIGKGEDPASYRRAARDFLLRHPARWLPRAAGKLESLDDPPAFWLGLLKLTASFCKADAAYLVGTEGPIAE